MSGFNEQYTGQESLAKKSAIQENPPQILLTNYVMLELMLSRTKGLAFRLHQFVSQDGSVYATIEAQENRFLTLEGQYTTTDNRLLYPLVFCRECGQDYYAVSYNSEQQVVNPLIPTALDTNQDDDHSREEQYHRLRAQTDPNSTFEREFLDELYKQGIKLPDSAQELISEINLKPDFVYRGTSHVIPAKGQEERERPS